MPPIVIAAAAALLGALCIPALARLIPFQIERAWQREVAEAQDTAVPAPDPARFALTLIERVAIVAGAIVLPAVALYFSTSSASTLSAAVYLLALLLLVAINQKHWLLPDIVVLPTLWLGLLLHALAGDASGFVQGACAAYMAPWAYAQLVRLSSNREVIGHGDLKCFAMAGAWFGLQALPTLFLAFVAAGVALAIIRAVLARADSAMPTALAHLVASLVVLAGVRVF